MRVFSSWLRTGNNLMQRNLPPWTWDSFSAELTGSDFYKCSVGKSMAW